MKWYRDKAEDIRTLTPVLSCCGDDCAVCPRRLAVTDEELHETAVFWHDVGWRDHVVSNGEIRCAGCGTRNGCAFMILPCMKEHAISDCRACPGYPCEKLHDMLRRSKVKEAQCKAYCTDLAEWELLKRAFYEKSQNLELL